MRRVARRHRKLLWTLVIVTGVLVAARLLLNPFAASHTRRVLASLEGYQGSFKDVSVSLWRLSYAIDGLKLVQVPTPRGASEKLPYFYADHVEIGLHWRALIDTRELVGTVEVNRPKLNIIVGKSKEESQTKVLDPALGQKLERLSALAVERLEVKQAEIAFTDRTSSGSPVIRLRDLDGTLENLATRVDLLHSEPTSLAASGTLQRTGQVSVFVTADPLAKRLAFAGRAAVKGLALDDAAIFLAEKADVAPRKGTIDLFAEFDAHDGIIAGGVKPILKNAEVAPAKNGVGPALKAWIADAALKIFSDRVPGRNATAAVIPIEGSVARPQARLWPTIWGVLRNSFVAGLEAGFSRLPAGKPEEKRVVPQARSKPRRRGG